MLLTSAVQPAETLRGARCTHAHDGGAGWGRCRAQDRHGRRDIHQRVSHGIELAVYNGDLGLLLECMKTKLHAIADANGRRWSIFKTAGQVSDYTGAAALMDELPKAHWLLGDRGG